MKDITAVSEEQLYQLLKRHTGLEEDELKVLYPSRTELEEAVLSLATLEQTEPSSDEAAGWELGSNTKPVSDDETAALARAKKSKAVKSAQRLERSLQSTKSGLTREEVLAAIHSLEAMSDEGDSEEAAPPPKEKAETPKTSTKRKRSK